MLEQKENHLGHFFSILMIFWGLWYVFFNPSLVLRPYYNILWPALSIMAFILNYSKIKQICYGFYKKQLYLYIAFLLVSIITLLFTVDISASIIYIERFFLGFIFALSITSTDNDRIIVDIIGIYTVILLCISLVQLLYPSLYLSYFFPLLSQTDSDLVTGALRRGELIGLTNGTSQNGLMMTIGFIVFLTKSIFSQKKKWLYILLSILFLAVTFSTGKRSYSGISVLIIGLSFVWSAKNTNIVSIVIRLILFSFFFSFLFLLVAEYFPQIRFALDKVLFHIEDGSIGNGREEIYDQIFQLFDNNLFGYGINTTKSLIDEDAHNSYLQWLVEYGIILVWIPYYAVILFPVSLLRKIHKNRQCLYNIKDEDICLCAFSFAILVLLSGFIAIPFQWTNVFMLYMVFLFILWKKLDKLNNNS